MKITVIREYGPAKVRLDFNKEEAGEIISMLARLMAMYDADADMYLDIEDS